MKQKALDLLNRVTSLRDTRGDRMTDVLRNPEDENNSGWFMHLPTCFNDALDIKQTPRILTRTENPVLVWTQGREFKFKHGDVIYDTPNGYKIWSEALRQIRFRIQVRRGINANSPPPPLNRNAGTVEFDVQVPNEDKTKLDCVASLTLTQDVFIRLLITGEGLPGYPFSEE